MKYVYIVLSKDKDGQVTIHGGLTNQTKAWELRDELADEGFVVACEKLTVNLETNILLKNCWSYRVAHSE